MIFEFRAHAQRGLDAHNVLDSQRPNVKLAEHLLQKPEATTIWMDFTTAAMQTTKTDPKDRKPTNQRGRNRGAIAPGNAITLRVQPLYEPCEGYVGAPQGIEIASASEFHKCTSPNPSATLIFLKKS